MEKYFKLTSNSKVNELGVTLFQIELIIDCKWGKKGDLGGWVEKDSNIYGGEIHGGVIYGGVIHKSPTNMEN